MKVTTVGGRSTGKTMAQLKQENDALKEQLSFLAGRVATLKEFCQVNNIGEWGDSVVSAVIKHCEGLAAQNASLVARIECIERVAQGALGFLPRALWDYAETIRESAKVRESPKIEL